MLEPTSVAPLRVMVCGPDLRFASGAGIQTHVHNVVQALERHPEYAPEAFAVTNTTYRESWFRKAVRGMGVALRFARAVRSYDVVYLNSTIDNRSVVRDGVLAVSARILRVPVAVQFHGGDASRITSPIARSFARRLARADVMAFLTEQQARDYSAAFGPVDYQLVRNGVDGPDAAPSHEHEDPALRVLFLGRLDADKGLPELLEAVSAVQPLASIKVAGDGPLRADVEKLAGEASWMSFEGFVGTAQRDELLEWADVLALPSHHEAMPYVVLEAMAFGVTVVATPVGALGDIVGGSGSGLLVQVGSASSIDSTLQRLAADRELVRALGSSGRAAWERGYSLDALAASVAELFRLATARQGEA